MDYPRFPTEVAATVAGVPLNTVNTWLKRGHISTYPRGNDLPPDLLFPGQGRKRLFTRRSIMHIALIARLARTGLPVDLASAAAMQFLDQGSGDLRALGEFFVEGGTALVIQFRQVGPKVTVTTRDQAAKSFFPAQLYKDDPVLVLDLEAFISAANRIIERL